MDKSVCPEEYVIDNIVTCIGLRMTYRQVLDWMIGFIDTLYTHNSRLQELCRDLHTLQFTVTHTRILRLHMSYPVNGFITLSL
jgi:hypothetical protein